MNTLVIGFLVCVAVVGVSLLILSFSRRAQSAVAREQATSVELEASRRALAVEQATGAAQRDRISESSAARDAAVRDLEQLRTKLEARLEEAQSRFDEMRKELTASKETCAGLVQRTADYSKRDEEAAQLRVELDASRRAMGEAGQEIATLETKLAEERRAAADKLETLKEASAQLEERFKGIAAQVLEQNREKFESTTKVSLGELLQPLGVRIKEFEQKVEATHLRDTTDRVALHAELQRLAGLGQQMNQDAVKLTKALRGDSQVQGAWGEVILNRLLEQSGLQPGREYECQTSFETEDGDRLRPDVIVHLPGKRDVVIDAKLSITAYEEYSSATDDGARAEALQRHLDSVRAHVKKLSGKAYWSLGALHTPDFVLMFVPLESAFIEAMRNDTSLFEYAFSKRVLITSPTTLLAMLRTIEHTWRLERQNENAREIVATAVKLYEKLTGFVADLQTVGTQLTRAQGAYEDAMGKLRTGKGNLIGRAERLRELGVKPRKLLPASLTGADENDDASASSENVGVQEQTVLA